MKITLKKAVDGLLSDFVLKLEKKPKNFGGGFYVPKFQKFQSKLGVFLAKMLTD